jgi:hypothetical protein
LIVPLIEVLRRVSLRIVTMPIQSQGIITPDNVSIDVSAVAYCRVVDPTKAVVAIENVAAAINQIAQTTLRKVVGQRTLDQTLAETDKNIQLPETIQELGRSWPGNRPPAPPGPSAPHYPADDPRMQQKEPQMSGRVHGQPGPRADRRADAAAGGTLE